MIKNIFFRTGYTIRGATSGATGKIISEDTMIKKFIIWLIEIFMRRKITRLAITDVSDIKAGDKIHVIGTDGVVKEFKK